MFPISVSSISRITKSLENLVTILPVGFESKNTISDLMTVFIILLCMLVALSRKMAILINVLIKDVNIKKTINKPNHRGYLESK